MAVIHISGDGDGGTFPSPVHAVLTSACLMVPWLNPFNTGPSAAVVPWLVSAACAVLLWGVWVHQGAGRPAGDSRPRLIATTWLAAALVSSVIGLFQYSGLAQHFATVMNVPVEGQAFGNLRQRNQFASLTVIGIAALLWWVARGLKIRHALPAVALLAVANAASGSRTGLLQLAMLTAFTAVWTGPRRKTRLVLCAAGWGAYLAAVPMLPHWLAAAAGADVAAPHALARLAASDGCSSRTVLWANVLQLIARKPWLGWGWGELDYAHFITLYDGPRFCEILDNAHNLPLHLAVELGVPAALLLCGAAAWAVWRARPWRETDATRQLAWSVLAVIALHSMLEYPLWYGPFQIAAGLCAWLLWCTRAGAAVLATKAVIGPMARWRWPLVAGLLGALGYAAWDYHRISQIYLEPEQRAAAYRQDTLEKIQASWLFRSPVRFAELTLTAPTRDNAAHINALAYKLLHYSPEPSVVERLIESAVLLGHDDEARFFMARYRAAYPQDYARWAPRGSAG